MKNFWHRFAWKCQKKKSSYGLLSTNASNYFSMDSQQLFDTGLTALQTRQCTALDLYLFLKYKCSRIKKGAPHKWRHCISRTQNDCSFHCTVWTHCLNFFLSYTKPQNSSVFFFFLTLLLSGTSVQVIAWFAKGTVIPDCAQLFCH